MSTTVIRFTNDFSDDTNGTVSIGPVDSSAINLNNIRTSVRNFNAQIAATDTGVCKLMQGKYGGDWQRISEVRLTTTNRVYVNLS